MQPNAYPPPPMPPPMGAAPPSFGGASGIGRFVAFARTLSFQAVGLGALVLVLQATMSEGHRPSDLFGGFHGSTESAELDAKRAAQVRTQRELANVQAAAPIIAQSLSSQADMANMADMACLGGNALASLFGRDAAPVADALKGACGHGDSIRDNMNRTINRAPDGQLYLLGR